MDRMVWACIAAVAVALIAPMAVALIAPMAAADAAVLPPPPLRQIDAGMAADDILCSSDRLLVSPGGAPACVFGGSHAVLEGRGWSAATAAVAAVPDAARAAPANAALRRPLHLRPT